MDSKFVHEKDNIIEVFVVFLYLSRKTSGGNLGCGLFLLHPFLFITHTPSYDSTLYEYCLMTAVWKVLCITGGKIGVLVEKNLCLVLTISEI